MSKVLVFYLNLWNEIGVNGRVTNYVVSSFVVGIRPLIETFEALQSQSLTKLEELFLSSFGGNNMKEIHYVLTEV